MNKRELEQTIKRFIRKFGPQTQPQIISRFENTGFIMNSRTIDDINDLLFDMVESGILRLRNNFKLNDLEYTLEDQNRFFHLNEIQNHENTGTLTYEILNKREKTRDNH